MRENIKTEVLNRVLKNMELIKLNELKKDAEPNGANGAKNSNPYYNNNHDHNHNKKYKLYSDNKNSSNDNNELNYINASVLNSFITSRGRVNGKFEETEFMTGQEGSINNDNHNNNINNNNNNSNYNNNDNNEFEFGQSLEARNNNNINNEFMQQQINSNNFSEQSSSQSASESSPGVANQSNNPKHPVK
jgi:ribosomal protein S18